MKNYFQAYLGLFNRSCPKECLEAVKKNGHALKYVKLNQVGRNG